MLVFGAPLASEGSRRVGLDHVLGCRAIGTTPLPPLWQVGSTAAGQPAPDDAVAAVDWTQAEALLGDKLAPVQQRLGVDLTTVSQKFAASGNSSL